MPTKKRLVGGARKLGGVPPKFPGRNDGDECLGERRPEGALRIERPRLIGEAVDHRLRCLWGEAKYIVVHS